MTILLTGGTGKSATPLANLLLQANQSVVLATRSGKVPAPFRGARFDWLDDSTYNIPFEVDPTIDRIYLIAPRIFDMFPPMKAFIDFAIEKGVKRFVLMSAGLLEAGGPAMGLVHDMWPSSSIVSATEDGLIGHISTDDIAEVPILVGPELLSYDQVASMLSDVLGRGIKHKRLTAEEYTAVMIQRGMPEVYAQKMSTADVLIGGGAEERLYKRANFVGKRKLRDFLEANKDAEEWRAKIN
ncbi:ergot alkaloid A [Mycena epipterygia]|nr:ergot alkaloid A [Mycena epipterygia]